MQFLLLNTSGIAICVFGVCGGLGVLGETIRSDDMQLAMCQSYAL